jgi:signal transduction histidine kinase
MKTIEFNPESLSAANRSGAPAPDELSNCEVFREIMPLVFHKLKNKLTPVLGYAQILQDRTNDEFIKERLVKIEKNTTELTQALNLLKDHFKIVPETKQPCQINAILQSLGRRWQWIANNQNIRIVLELDSAVPDLLLNARQLQIVVLNLVENAVAALKNKGEKEKEIRLTTRLETDCLHFFVHDNGSGINETELEKIWAPFYSTCPGHPGLGLVLCEKIIADHAAQCVVRSRPGEFCQFEIRFPLPENLKGKKSAENTLRSRS